MEPQYKPRNAAATYIIWDYNKALPIAQVKNVTFNLYNYDNVSAYTSFEANGQGNWYFGGTPTFNRTAPTGSMAYNLYGTPIWFNNADLAKAHVLLYWSDGGTATVQVSSTSYPGVALKNVNGWTLYKHNIPALTSSSTLMLSSGGSLNIDELKTYPADAQMTTYIYDVNGLMQTVDEKDQISKFEYDEAQRLKNVKDWQGNMVKSYGYHNYDMTVGNDLLPAKTFTRNNCPSGSSPQSTTYSVAANTYYSSTKASANALAVNDQSINGQNKANDPAICGCPVQYNTFTFNDQTGAGTYGANFSGDNSYSFNIPSGRSTQQVTSGTYTIQMAVSGTQTRTFQLTGQSSITGRTATFTNVVVAPGTPLTLTIN